jgi:autotransporter-associated beta strand protein
MLILGANNTYTGSTTVKSGTLKANATNALGATNVIDVQGGSLLIAASETMNDKANIVMGNAQLQLTQVSQESQKNSANLAISRSEAL